MSSRFSRSPARRRGPWDTEYTSLIMWPSTERFFRSLIGQGLAHWEVGSVALQIITWQWTKTSGWSAINLKASRKNRWALGEGEGRSFTVSSTGHLEKRNTVKLSIAVVAVVVFHVVCRRNQQWLTFSIKVSKAVNISTLFGSILRNREKNFYSDTTGLDTVWLDDDGRVFWSWLFSVICVLMNNKAIIE